MKRTVFIITFLIVLFSFHACEDDGFSLDKTVMSVATVNPIDDNYGTYYLTMDNGTTLWPAASDVIYRPKANQRVVVNFTPLSDKIGEFDHYVKVNYLQEILTKNIEELTTENEKEIGNDPIRILAIWVGDNYLNIRFGYNTGGEKIHRVSLVKNMIQPATGENEEIVLEFRHNAYGDPQNYGVKSYAAFDLKPLQKEDKGVINLKIVVHDFNNETKEYEVAYEYGYVHEPTDASQTIKDLPDNIKYF